MGKPSFHVIRRFNRRIQPAVERVSAHKRLSFLSAGPADQVGG